MSTGISCVNVFLDCLRIIPMYVVAFFAYKGYGIGKIYFNKGQENAIAFEEIKLFYKQYNSIKSEFVDLERNLISLFQGKVSDSGLEIIMEQISNIHNELERKTKKALFIEVLLPFREKYLKFYQNWFVDESIESYIFEGKEKTDEIKDEFLSDLQTLKILLNSILSEKKSEWKKLSL